MPSTPDNAFTSPVDESPTEGATPPLATLFAAAEKQPKEPRSPRYRRIDATEAGRIFRLRNLEGLSLEAIAKATNRSLSTISEFLAKYPDRTQEAVAILRTRATEAAQAWGDAIAPAALRGDHRPAKDLLAATGAIQDTSAVKVGVQVNLGHSAEPLPADLAFEIPVETTGSDRD